VGHHSGVASRGTRDALELLPVLPALRRFADWHPIGRANRHLVAFGLVAASGLSVFGPSLGVRWFFPIAATAAAFILFVGARNLGLFLLAVLAVRPSSDSLGKSGPLIAAAVVGLSVLWIVVQPHLRETWRLSASMRWLTYLGGALVISSAGSETMGTSINTAMKVLSVVVVCIAVQMLRPTTRAADKGDVSIVFAWAIVVSSVAPVIVGLIQMQMGVYLLDEYLGLRRIQATFLNPSALADYLTLSMAAGFALVPMVRGRLRVAVLVLLAASGVVLLNTYTRIGWIGAFLAAFIVCWRTSRRAAWGLIALSIIASVSVPTISNRLADLVSEKPDDISFTGSANSAQWRAGFWERRFEDFKPTPLTGLGLDSTLVKLKYNTHNTYLQVLLEGGVISAVAFLGVIGSFIATLRRVMRRGPSLTLHERFVVNWVCAAGAAYMLLMVSENVMTLPTVSWCLVVPLACLVRIDLAHRRDELRGVESADASVSVIGSLLSNGSHDSVDPRAANGIVDLGSIESDPQLFEEFGEAPERSVPTDRNELTASSSSSSSG
jgi:O-antigen ligase